MGDMSSKKMECSAAEWEKIFNTINDAITIHDDEFNIVWANKAARELLKLDEKDILSNKCFLSYHGTECAPEGCPSCNVLKTGESADVEVFEPFLKKHIEIKALPRFDDEGKVIGLVHIVRDITLRKEAEEKTHEKIAELEAFHKVTVNREVRMLEIREELDELKEKLKKKEEK